MKKKATRFLLYCLALFGHANAQTNGWHYQANVSAISESGFYNIIFTPAITAKLKADYSDFRIIDKTSKWVPYVLRTPGTEKSIEDVILSLQVLTNETKAGTTEVIVNADSAKLSNLVLQFKNTAAERFCSLAGSDNNSAWFTINDSILIQPQATENGTATFFLHFPPVNYKHYRLRILNSDKPPLNITGVGYETQANGPGTQIFIPHLDNPPSTTTQKDSGKISYVKVMQGDSYHFDRISLKISGAKYYQRNVSLYIPSSNTHSISQPGAFIKSFVVSNNSTLDYSLPASKANTFYLLIENRDNPPLHIDSIKTANSYTIASTYLEKASACKILLGNATAEQPDFDLQQLNVVDKGNFPVLATGDISPVLQKEIANKPAAKNGWLIWMAIGIAAVVLGFFTYKLISDMNKTKA